MTFFIGIGEERSSPISVPQRKSLNAKKLMQSRQYAVYQSFSNINR